MSTTAPEPVAGGRTHLAGALVVPATIFVAIGLIGPIAILFRYSLNQFIPGQFMVDGLTIENYVKFFTDSYYLNVLWRTVRVSVICTIACLIMGFPLAYVLARTQSRFKNLMVIAVVLPLFVGNAVRSAGWMTAFGSKGALNASLMGLGLLDQPLEIMFTETAVIIGIIAVNLPFMVLTLQSVIEGINRNVEEAGRDVPPRALAARHARHPRRHDPDLHPGDERLCHAGPARRSQIPDHGPAGLRPVRPAEQLALRRCHLLHPDDRDDPAHRRRQPDRAAALPLNVPPRHPGQAALAAPIRDPA
jgi:ABC-type spermidine/putrescine transport system permease subunit II